MRGPDQPRPRCRPARVRPPGSRGPAWAQQAACPTPSLRPGPERERSALSSSLPAQIRFPPRGRAARLRPGQASQRSAHRLQHARQSHRRPRQPGLRQAAANATAPGAATNPTRVPTARTRLQLLHPPLSRDSSCSPLRLRHRIEHTSKRSEPPRHARPRRGLVDTEPLRDDRVGQVVKDTKPKRLTLLNTQRRKLDTKRLTQRSQRRRLIDLCDVVIRDHRHLNPKLAQSTPLYPATPQIPAQLATRDREQPRTRLIRTTRPQTPPATPRLRERLRCQVQRHLRIQRPTSKEHQHRFRLARIHLNELLRTRHHHLDCRVPRIRDRPTPGKGPHTLPDLARLEGPIGANTASVSVCSVSGCGGRAGCPTTERPCLTTTMRRPRRSASSPSRRISSDTPSSPPRRRSPGRSRSESEDSRSSSHRAAPYRALRQRRGWWGAVVALTRTHEPGGRGSAITATKRKRAHRDWCGDDPQAPLGSGPGSRVLRGWQRPSALLCPSGPVRVVSWRRVAGRVERCALISGEVQACRAEVLFELLERARTKDDRADPRTVDQPG